MPRQTPSSQLDLALDFARQKRQEIFRIPKYDLDLSDADKKAYLEELDAISLGLYRSAGSAEPQTLTESFIRDYEGVRDEFSKRQLVPLNIPIADKERLSKLYAAVRDSTKEAPAGSFRYEISESGGLIVVRIKTTPKLQEEISGRYYDGLRQLVKEEKENMSNERWQIERDKQAIREELERLDKRYDDFEEQRVRLEKREKALWNSGRIGKAKLEQRLNDLEQLDKQLDKHKQELDERRWKEEQGYQAVASELEEHRARLDTREGRLKAAEDNLQKKRKGFQRDVRKESEKLETREGYIHGKISYWRDYFKRYEVYVRTLMSENNKNFLRMRKRTEKAQKELDERAKETTERNAKSFLKFLEVKEQNLDLADRRDELDRLEADLDSRQVEISRKEEEAGKKQGELKEKERGLGEYEASLRAWDAELSQRIPGFVRELSKEIVDKYALPGESPKRIDNFVEQKGQPTEYELKLQELDARKHELNEYEKGLGEKRKGWRLELSKAFGTLKERFDNLRVGENALGSIEKEAIQRQIDLEKYEGRLKDYENKLRQRDNSLEQKQKEASMMEQEIKVKGDELKKYKQELDERSGALKRQADELEEKRKAAERSVIEVKPTEGDSK